MLDYIIEYLGEHGTVVLSDKEQSKLEGGIKLYLLENGIDQNERREYYKQFVRNSLQKVNKEDFKNYFMEYKNISDVRQIVFEYQADGKIPAERRQNLIQCMEDLYKSGLGVRYIPATEVSQIINSAT